VAEAKLHDGVPQTAGWFVVNAREGPWMHNEMRSVCRFGGAGEARFDELGLGLYWLEPGHPMAMYHQEAGQEDFLVLRGRCVLIVEGAERRLGAWDLFHCPPSTPHTIVASGKEPALVVAVGVRKKPSDIHYPVDPTALRHGAGVERATSRPAEAYARFTEPRRGPAPSGL
jgi:uncharacterized cupin superfamily protein